MNVTELRGAWPGGRRTVRGTLTGLLLAAACGGCGGSLAQPSLQRSNAGVAGINNNAPAVVDCAPASASLPAPISSRRPAAAELREAVTADAPPATHQAGASPARVRVVGLVSSTAPAINGLLGTEAVTYRASGAFVSVEYALTNESGVAVRPSQVGAAFGIEVGHQRHALLATGTADPGCAAVQIAYDQSRHLSTSDLLAPGHSVSAITVYSLPPPPPSVLAAGGSLHLYWVALAGAPRVDLGLVRAGQSGPGA